MIPDFPTVIPDLYIDNLPTPAWAQHAKCYVLHDGLPVWLEGRRIWAVIGGAWQLVPDTPEYRVYYVGRYNHWRYNKRRRAGLFALNGPDIHDNPDNVTLYTLFPQFTITAQYIPLTTVDTKAYFERYPVYGLVWKGTKGRVGKATREQFGLPWPDEELLALIHSEGIAQ